MLLFDPSGKPLPTPSSGRLPSPLREMTRDLVLAGPGGLVPRRTAATGWAVPLALMLPALMTGGEVPEHAAISGWRTAARLGLELVAQQRVHPGLTADGHDCWRAGPVTEPLRGRSPPPPRSCRPMRTACWPVSARSGFPRRRR
ncbi:hypothetical protein NKH18_38895 [Streptomyces sp. M10(2022)]